MRRLPGKKYIYVLGLFIAVILLGTGIIAFLKQTNPRSVTISLTGDIMLSRGVQQYLDEYGYDYPYDSVREILKEDDFTVGNLECPITESGNPADKPIRFIFQADPNNAHALKNAGFDCLNLANNHSMDYKSQGLSDTMTYLEDAGLLHMGASENSDESSSLVLEKNGIRIGFLAYSTFPPEGFFYSPKRSSVRYLTLSGLPSIKEDIEEVNCDFTIVYFHWGVEFQPYPSELQKQFATAAAEAGANFIVGTHPHVLQGEDTIQGVPVYYSLGNFIFDHQIPPGTDESVILQLTITPEGLSKIKEIPVSIHDGQAIPVNTPD